MVGISPRARAWLGAHRSQVLEGATLASLVAVAAVLAYLFDWLPDAARPPASPTIKLDEAFVIFALLGTGLVIFAFRRLQDARVETRRRLLAEREARTLALSDPLTGLANRRRFDDALAQALAKPPASGSCHALMTLDLNGFKTVNDVHGHGVGDELLGQVAARLRRAVRHDDLVARLGGDEFAVLAQGLLGAEAAMGSAIRILQAFESPIRAGQVEHAVGVAIGISLFPGDAAVPTELLRRADIALHKAKAEKLTEPRAARFFEAEMDAHIRERDVLQRELQAAIRDGAIRPFYQPLVNMADGRIVGFETLARWTSPTLGQVSPARFIPLAEDVGLIGPLSEAMFEQACRDAVTWPADVTLAFNMSAALLKSETFGLRLLAILGRTGLAPARVELEITETALVRDLEGARRILGRLRGSGVRIALDDFGTGYSSLYHLRAFTPDKIKIDKSFVDDMCRDGRSATIIRALIGLGVGLGATVVAEGVETAEQERLLREQGCEQGQGHLFSAAVDAARAKELLFAPAARAVV